MDYPYSHCPHSSLDSDEADSSSEPSEPSTSLMTGVAVHLVIGSINSPNNRSGWPDAVWRRLRFLRVSPNIITIGLVAGKSKGSAMLPGTGGKAVYNQWIHCDLIMIF